MIPKLLNVLANMTAEKKSWGVTTGTSPVGYGVAIPLPTSWLYTTKHHEFGNVNW